MTKLFRAARRRRYEVETSVTTIPTDVVSDESKAIPTRVSDDETDRLTRARRQHSRAESGSPAETSPPTSPTPKRRSWLRFFGL